VGYLVKWFLSFLAYGKIIEALLGFAPEASHKQKRRLFSCAFKDYVVNIDYAI
jgi:hypothetical protein